MTPQEKRFMVHALRSSIMHKKKAGWKRDVSAGFISEDLQKVSIFNKSKQEGTTVGIIMHGGMSGAYKLQELNIRETEEILKFVKDTEAINCRHCPDHCPNESDFE